MDDHQETAWQSLGNLVAGDRRTVFSTPAAMRPIPGDPTTMEESRALRLWASSVTTAIPVPATHDQITNHLKFLASTLPAKNIDDDAGKMRFAVYLSMIQGFSDAALAHMSRRVCETLDWFPTPRQCLELAKEYRVEPTEKWSALLACNRFDQAAFEVWIDSIGMTEPDLKVPSHWIDIALTRNLLRRLDDGPIVSRALHNAQRDAEREKAA